MSGSLRRKLLVASETHLLTTKVLAQPEAIQVTLKSWRWLRFRTDMWSEFLCKKEPDIWYKDKLLTIFIFILSLSFFFAKKIFEDIFQKEKRKRRSGNIEILLFFSPVAYVLFSLPKLRAICPLSVSSTLRNQKLVLSDNTKIVQNHLKWLSHSVLRVLRKKQEEGFCACLYKMIRVKEWETTRLQPGKSHPGFLYETLHCWPCCSWCQWKQFFPMMAIWI